MQSAKLLAWCQNQQIDSEVLFKSSKYLQSVLLCNSAQ